jgi:hypothetical protein
MGDTGLEPVTPKLVELWVYVGLWRLVERFLLASSDPRTFSRTEVSSRAAE